MTALEFVVELARALGWPVAAVVIVALGRHLLKAPTPGESGTTRQHTRFKGPLGIEAEIIYHYDVRSLPDVVSSADVSEGDQL